MKPLFAMFIALITTILILLVMRLICSFFIERKKPNPMIYVRDNLPKRGCK